MSSRSFRRRNNRRRRRQGGREAFPPEQRPARPQEDQQQGRARQRQPRRAHRRSARRAQGRAADPPRRRGAAVRARDARPHAGADPGGRTAEPRDLRRRQSRSCCRTAPSAASRFESLPPRSLIVLHGSPHISTASCASCAIRTRSPRRRRSATSAAELRHPGVPPAGEPARFVIKKRIQYEEKETPQEWKKPLQVSC